jgi:hypothetical protein
VSRFYEVTVKVLVVAPPQHSRAVEKIVHGLVQEYLPGIETGIDETSRIVGASVIVAEDVGPSDDNEEG